MVVRLIGGPMKTFKNHWFSCVLNIWRFLDRSQGSVGSGVPGRSSVHSGDALGNGALSATRHPFPGGPAPPPGEPGTPSLGARHPSAGSPAPLPRDS